MKPLFRLVFVSTVAATAYAVGNGNTYWAVLFAFVAGAYSVAMTKHYHVDPPQPEED